MAVTTRPDRSPANNHRKNVVVDIYTTMEKHCRMGTAAWSTIIGVMAWTDRPCQQTPLEWSQFYRHE
jgi:hypothetical protein